MSNLCFIAGTDYKQGQQELLCLFVLRKRSGVTCLTDFVRRTEELLSPKETLGWELKRMNGGMEPVKSVDEC